MIEERILDKIKKCLALSASPEPEEAAAALRQAQKLMEKYGVSQFDLSASDIGEIDVKTKVAISRVNDWELRLIHLVAKAFGCRVLWTKGFYRTCGHYTLIGLKTQLPLAQYTCAVLQRKLASGRVAFVNGLPEHWDRKRKTIEADGFCYGWVKAVASKVTALAHGEETKKLIEHKLNSITTTTAKVRSRAAGAAGYAAGLDAGMGESLYRPMEQSASQPKLN